MSPLLVPSIRVHDACRVMARARALPREFLYYVGSKPPLSLLYCIPRPYQIMFRQMDKSCLCSISEISDETSSVLDLGLYWSPSLRPYQIMLRLMDKSCLCSISEISDETSSVMDLGLYWSPSLRPYQIMLRLMDKSCLCSISEISDETSSVMDLG